VVLVVLWSAGATVELFLTTFSVGANVTPAAVTVALLVAVLLATIAIGARSRQWLANPRSYW
ncbi:MAG: hypothetical protein ACQET5_14105, partial [Halobacteriota archaeon]